MAPYNLPGKRPMLVSIHGGPEGLHGIFANVTALGSFLGTRLSMAMEA